MPRLRRRTFLVLAAFIFVAGGAGLWLWAGAKAVVMADGNRIQAGMTTEEVLAILGPPHSSDRLQSTWWGRTDTWDVVDGTIVVTYSADGRVRGRLSHNLYGNVWTRWLRRLGAKLGV